METRKLDAYFSKHHAVQAIDLVFPNNSVTAIMHSPHSPLRQSHSRSAPAAVSASSIVCSAETVAVMPRPTHIHP